MKQILLLSLIIIVIINIYFILNRKEKYTFADYDKFPPCWCNRNLDIVWFNSHQKLNQK